jgi:hypothetical protein
LTTCPENTPISPKASKPSETKANRETQNAAVKVEKSQTKDQSQKTTEKNHDPTSSQ